MNLIIILGNYDTDICRSRCECAATYFKKNFKYISSEISDDVYSSHKILCSGAGRRLVKENMSEAEHMKNMLIKFGIDPIHIDIEDKSNTTEENLIFCKNLIFGPKESFTYNSIIRNIIICTSKYHINRSIVIAKDVFANTNIEILALFDNLEPISEKQSIDESIFTHRYIDKTIAKINVEKYVF